MSRYVALIVNHHTQGVVGAYDWTPRDILEPVESKRRLLREWMKVSLLPPSDEAFYRVDVVEIRSRKELAKIVKRVDLGGH